MHSINCNRCYKSTNHYNVYYKYREGGYRESYACGCFLGEYVEDEVYYLTNKYYAIILKTSKNIGIDKFKELINLF